MIRTALAGALVAATIAVAAPAQADPPECYTVERLPGECLTLATFTYITSLEGARDHLIGQILNERAEKQAAQLEVASLRQDLSDTDDVLAARNQRISVLKAKLEWARHVNVRLWRALNRLR